MEQRCPLSPSLCQLLLQEGIQIIVERSSQRIFSDQEFEQSGCQLVPEFSWKNAPLNAFILGLKELPENDFPLPHTHIYFGHCYKGQAGWDQLLRRFVNGNGLLLDLEFLVNDTGRRIAAFGYHAGFAGAAVGLMTWAKQELNQSQGLISPFPNEELLLNDIHQLLDRVVKTNGKSPQVMVMGALGRCGTGACDFLIKAGIPPTSILRWDMNETAKGGPFDEILNVDIFVNCIYLSQPIPPFLTLEQLEKKDKRLSVVVDVSCDATNPHNPIPIYHETTDFDAPVTVVTPKNGASPVSVVAIDHLPTLLPRESSEAFGKDLAPHLLDLNKGISPVWLRAKELYNEKISSL